MGDGGDSVAQGELLKTIWSSLKEHDGVHKVGSGESNDFLSVQGEGGVRVREAVVVGDVMGVLRSCAA